MPKNIILYDFLLVKGGAESLTLSLLENIAAINLCIAFKDDDVFPDSCLSAVDHLQLTTITRITGWQSLKSIFAFKNKTGFLSKYKQVIYSGIYAPVAVNNHPNGKNILYCHTPPRFVYDLKDFYLKQAAWWQKPLLKFLSFLVKYHYEQAIGKMDLIIANSENVKQRIKYYLAKDAIVVHPPIAVEKFNWLEQGDFYLSLARVEPYKRVELIVRSFMAMPDKKLVVASGGSDLEKLERLAMEAKNIEFTGWCDDARLYDLMGRCIATIYIPPDEDFGMSPVESMAAGKPVIGVAEGGLLETIIDGKTGLLIAPEPNKNLLIDAIKLMTPDKALTMRDACEARAALYRTEVFIDKMKTILN